MKLTLLVKTGKKATKVTKTGEHEYTIQTSARPERGRANTAVLKALADHLGLPPSSLKIISGMTSKKKIVEVI